MILKESRDLEWIQELRSRYQFTNPTLIEKTIRAFSLLEALSVSGCPFVILSPAIDAKLRNLKKYRPEAFFYWSQVDMLLK